MEKKLFYIRIAKAIIKKSNEDAKDYRPLLREWIRLFEDTNVKGFSRDEFLDIFGNELKRKDTVENGIQEE